MELTGKIIAVLPFKTGTSARGEWKAQHYVLETEERYPQRLLFEVFGAEQIERFAIKEGEKITVSFNTEAKEINGNWYGSNRAWNVIRPTNV